jgi:hypothetical protein
MPESCVPGWQIAFLSGGQWKRMPLRSRRYKTRAAGPAPAAHRLLRPQAAPQKVGPGKARMSRPRNALLPLPVMNCLAALSQRKSELERKRHERYFAMGDPRSTEGFAPLEVESRHISRSRHRPIILPPLSPPATHVVLLCAPLWSRTEHCRERLVRADVQHSAGFDARPV